MTDLQLLIEAVKNAGNEIAGAIIISRIIWMVFK